MTARTRWLVGLSLLACAAAVIAIKLTTCGRTARRMPVPVPPDHRAPEATRIVATGRAVVHPDEPDRDGIQGTLRLEGQVIDESQQPVSGALISLEPDNQVVTSDPDGSFAFDHLVARSYRLSARKQELCSPKLTVRLSETTEPVILRMRAGATLIVHVMDGRAAVAGAKVVLDLAPAVLSNTAGDAMLPGLGPDFHNVEVTAGGYAPLQITILLGDEPAGTIERTASLRRGAPVSGVVLGPDDKPLADADVDFEALEGRWSESARTDGAGAWQLAAVSAGMYHLRATSETYGQAPDLAMAFDGVTPVRGVVLRVEVAAQLVGTVIDTGGKPVAGAAIAAASSGDEYDARTDSNGRFAMLGIDAGTYEVYARSGGLASPSTRVTIADGGRAEVRIVVDDAGISGKVVDNHGDPVAEAAVTAMPDEGSRAFGHDVTDSHGGFDLGGLPPGNYHVNATWPDQPDRRLSKGQGVRTGDHGVKIVLARPATLTGRVLLDGSPLPYYGILITEHPKFFFSGEPREVRGVEGRFTLRAVEPGSWGIVLQGPGTARKTIADIKVEADKVTDLGDIVMSHGQQISGRVRDAARSPVAGARVTVGMISSTLEDDPFDQSFKGEFTTTTDADGAYRFAGIAPMEGARISATHPDRGSSLGAVVPPGDATIDFTLVTPSGIIGTVVGLAHPAGTVTAVRRDEPGVLRSDINGAGAFRFDGLVPGDYTIAMFPVPDRGVVPAPVTVTVVANQRAKVRLVLPKSSVTLIIKVVGGTCSSVMLLPPGDEAARARDARAYQFCSAGEATIAGVPPGSYRACSDGDCAPITVTSTPATQTVEIRVAPGP